MTREHDPSDDEARLAAVLAVFALAQAQPLDEGPHGLPRGLAGWRTRRLAALRVHPSPSPSPLSSSASSAPPSQQRS